MRPLMGMKGATGTHLYQRRAGGWKSGGCSGKGGATDYWGGIGDYFIHYLNNASVICADKLALFRGPYTDNDLRFHIYFLLKCYRF